MGRLIDLTGKRFGRLTVVERVPDLKPGRPRWLCICDCGNSAIVDSTSLNSGHTASCGCLRSDFITITNTTHGESSSRLYAIWSLMKRRCLNSNDPAYKYYGGRGISLCDDWHHYEMFRDWAVVNGYDNTLTIDRIDINGDYEPQNCRWVSRAVQANNRCNSINLCISGITMTMTQWAKCKNMKPQTVWYRLRHGWSPEEALTVPPGGKRHV